MCVALNIKKKRFAPHRKHKAKVGRIDDASPVWLSKSLHHGVCEIVTRDTSGNWTDKIFSGRMENDEIRNPESEMSNRILEPERELETETETETEREPLGG